MTGHYFRLHDNVYIPDRWELESPVDQQDQEVQALLFREGEPVTINGRLRIPICTQGKALDFSLGTVRK